MHLVSVCCKCISFSLVVSQICFKFCHQMFKGAGNGFLVEAIFVSFEFIIPTGLTNITPTQDILKRTLVKREEVYAFLELHIEQGPLLEAEGLQLGVVTAIAAPAALRVTFKGGGGHAGALLMPDRYPSFTHSHTLTAHMGLSKGLKGIARSAGL